MHRKGVSRPPAFWHALTQAAAPLRHPPSPTHRGVALLGGTHAVVGGLVDAVGPAGQAVADVDGEAARPVSRDEEVKPY